MRNERESLPPSPFGGLREGFREERNETFVIDAADVNVDGTISIADAAGVINMILL